MLQNPETEEHTDLDYNQLLRRKKPKNHIEEEEEEESEIKQEIKHIIEWS